MRTGTKCSPFRVLKSTLENRSISPHEKILSLLGLRRETMTDLSKAAGCSRASLYKAIHGQHTMRNWDPLYIRERIADHLGVKVSEIWIDEPEPDEVEFFEGSGEPVCAA